jgi:hypothetical protein
MIKLEDIQWVKNSRTREFEDELNVIAVKRKMDYPKQGTIVKLTQIKEEFPNADIRFNDGDSEGLCYLHFSRRGQWGKDANGNWNWVSDPNQPNPQEGYIHAVTNTYGMTDQGLWNLAETMNLVKKVLIERILEKV